MASGDGGMSFGIVKLGLSNYQTWKFRMEMLLRKEDLWEVVSKEPSASDALSAEWQKRDSKATGLIGLLVDDGQIAMIRNQASAHQAWTALKDYHEKPTMTSKVMLLRQVWSQRLAEGGNLEQHLQTIKESIDKLVAMGQDIPESLQVAMILHSLPDSFSSMVTALDTRPENELTLTLVQNILLNENKRRQCKETSSESSEQAMKADNALECYFCRQKGHKKWSCLKYKKFLAKKQGKPSMATKVEECESDSEESTAKDKAYRAYSVAHNEKQSSTWYLDSAATKHMTNDVNFFEFLDKKYTSTVKVANQQYSQVCGKGSGKITCALRSGEEKILHLKDVLYVPSFDSGLLSVRCLDQLGYKLVIEKGVIFMLKDGAEMGTADARDGMYALRLVKKERAMRAATHTQECIHVWHRRLGHRNPQDIKKMFNNGLVQGMNLKQCSQLEVCESCIKGKITRKFFPKKSSSQAEKFLDLIHMDLCGPMSTPTVGGRRYLFTLVDDYSRYVFVYLLTNKSKAIEVIKDFVENVSTQFGQRPKCFRSDRGGEFTSNALDEFFRSQGIRVQKTAPYTPEQNGVAERMNRTLVEATRTMLIDAGLAEGYWGEAMVTSGYLHNRVPTRVRDKTPYELVYGKPPGVSHLRVYGCKAFAHVPKQLRRKLDVKTRECVLIGYSQQSKAYRLLEKGTGKIIISRDVEFIESELQQTLESTRFMEGPGEVGFAEKFNKHEGLPANVVYIPHNSEGQDALQKVIQPREVIRENKEPLIEFENPNEGSRQHLDSSGSEVDDRPLVERLREVDDARPVSMVYADDDDSRGDPLTLKQALSSPEAAQWKRAMDEEMDSLRANDTWNLEPVPRNQDVIGCKWVFKRKRHADGSLDKFKARLVARGFSQKFGKDYDEVFAPVVRHTTVRTLLSIAGARNLFVRHFDAKTAFLNGRLTKTIYLAQPPGYVDEGKRDWGCKLNKSLYGLKQAANCWHKRLKEALNIIGFEQCESDNCLFRTIAEPRVYLTVHVDDMLVVSESLEKIESVKQALNQQFSIVDLGEPKCHLGVEMRRDEAGNFYLSQKNYIWKIIERTKLTEAKASSFPMDTGYEKARVNSPVIDNDVYKRLIGALLYLTVNSRPDIAAAVSILSQRVQSPCQADWNELQRTCRYLKHTAEYELKLSDDATEEKQFVGYADASWAEQKDTRKSNSGFIFLFNGGAICWASRRQDCVTLSSTESELVALSEAGREVKWIRKILRFLDETQDVPTLIKEDNQSCLNMLKNPGNSEKSKHVDTKYFYIKELQEKSIVDLEYCSTVLNVADMLTKPLGPLRLKTLSAGAGLKLFACDGNAH